jgi:hypothetical protein
MYHRTTAAILITSTITAAAAAPQLLHIGYVHHVHMYVLSLIAASVAHSFVYEHTQQREGAQQRNLMISVLLVVSV